MHPIPYERLEVASIEALNSWYEQHGNELFYEGKTKEGKLIKFNANFLALYLHRKYPVVTLIDTDELWLYNELTGDYEEHGDKSLEVIIQQMFREDYTGHKFKQTLSSLKPLTYISRDEFTLPLNMIPVKNGIIKIPAKNINNPTTWDFINIRLLGNSPKHYVTNRISAKYEPGQDCPRFKTFLQQVMPPDAIPFLQEYVGYTLYRSFPFHKTVMLIGPTSTGKSTFIRTIIEFIGKNNHISIALQDLGDKFQRVQLYNKLLNTQADISPKALKDSAWFKQITGNDYIAAERKYEQGFMFIPYDKHFWSCNRIPYSYDESDAFYIRFRIVTVNQRQHNPNAPDTDHYLLDKLTSPNELSGILNWALEGLERLLKQGYFTNDHPPHVTREIWASQSDPLSKFMLSDWVRLDRKTVESKDKLWEHFKFFCEYHNIIVPARNGFFKEIHIRYVTKGMLNLIRPFDQETGEYVYSIEGLALNLPGEAVDIVNRI